MCECDKRRRVIFSTVQPPVRAIPPFFSEQREAGAGLKRRVSSNVIEVPIQFLLPNHVAKPWNFRATWASGWPDRTSRRSPIFCLRNSRYAVTRFLSNSPSVMIPRRNSRIRRSTLFWSYMRYRFSLLRTARFGLFRLDGTDRARWVQLRYPDMRVQRLQLIKVAFPHSGEPDLEQLPVRKLPTISSCKLSRFTGPRCSSLSSHQTERAPALRMRAPEARGYPARPDGTDPSKHPDSAKHPPTVYRIPQIADPANHPENRLPDPTPRSTRFLTSPARP